MRVFFTSRALYFRSLRVPLWLLLSFSISFFLAPPLSLSLSLCLSPPPLSLSLSLSLSLALLKIHSFCPSNMDHCHHHWCALKEKNKLKTTLKSSLSCCLESSVLRSSSFFFFVNIFPNPKQKIHVPGYMLKFIPQLAKLCISFYNLKALCEQTSWLTHVANDHDVIDLLSCNSILDHFQTSSFYSTAVDRAWFFTSNKY